jgi:adenylate cyclase
MGLVGRKPSRKNPNLCQYCFDHLPAGGIEIDIGVLFADVRGSTTMGEATTPTEFAGRLNRFYSTATDTLVRHDGLIDKLIGDEVMGLFIPGLAGADYRRKTALAAVDLARAVRDLPVGVAASAGTAFVGNVGSGTVMDFTALGDAVNVAARLQAQAQPGQVVLASDLYALVAADHRDPVSCRIDVRGRDQPVDVHILTP